MTTRLFVFAAAAALLAGCTQKEPASIQIEAVCSMPDDCMFPPDGCSVQHIGPTLLDIAAGDRLNLGVNVQNNLEPNGDDEGGSGHVNTNDAEIRRASITYSASGLTLTARTQTVSIWVDASTTSVIWFNPIPQEAWLEIVNAGVVPAYDPLDPTTTLHITAHVTFSGVLGDGSHFEIAPKPFPVALCSGCIAPPTCEVDETPYACGGIGQFPRGRVTCTENGNPPVVYRLGGTILDLTGNGLDITCTPGGTITVNSDGSGSQTFVMANNVTDNSDFTCSLDATATGQPCAFVGTSNTGTVSGGDVNSIAIDCAP